MAEAIKEVAPDPGQGKGKDPQTAQIEKLIMSYGEQTFHEFSRFRFAEEREWYEQALFYQRRQWLRWNDSTRRYDQIKQDPSRPKPMPVSNYFAKAINDNANQLQKPRVTAVSLDEADTNRRAAEYAETAIAAIDKESGFDILRPILAKHVPLWGIGITKDCVDTSISTGIVRIAELQMKKQGMVSCLDCGQASPTAQPEAQTPNQKEEGDVAAQDTNAPNLETAPDNHNPLENATTCPKCGSANVRGFEAQDLEATGVRQFPKGQLRTEVVPIFELYLPRVCRNPNLAPRIVHRYRQSLGKLRQDYGDKAANLQAEAPFDVHQLYMEALRALVNYNYMHEQTTESSTVTELWWQWQEMPKRLQARMEAYWADDLETLESAMRQGMYAIYCGGTMLDWGVNPWWDKTETCSYTPYTFYLWEVDPANVYPKGIAVDLVPLQKRLNRLDSLIELAMMCNGAGKWLWPLTQSGPTPSGSPNEVVPYEVIGEGKNVPTFVPAQPLSADAWTLRAGILADFQQLGNTLGIQQGTAPQGAKAFRALAYIGAKAEESVGTQRYLWELANVLRYRKTMLMAQMCWDTPRKTRVAGYNGKFGMMSLEGSMLKGEYQIDFVPDSSRPQLPSEKEQKFAALLQSGMIDITDSATREYVLDVVNLDDVNLADHLQYLKAERDLEKVKQGQMPVEVPFQKWDIFLKVFANFTLTEEFEELPPPVQQMVLMYTSHLNQMTTMAMAPPPGMAAGGAAQALGAALAGKKQPGGPHGKPSHAGAVLNKVPGENVSPAAAQNAATNQGAGVAAQLP